ncbi:protein arginine N-methyltransferase 5 isoform X3 [Capricornis sumatraensis]|uniref:protein arginine N-methyltransferase 5 isoform X4 n=1 Tax=Bubalus carabanensis TaxID=3119969 RepID=UPI00244E846F|nr:protein arginine N-methyltransferase 5 isoform X4 [Bubalus carabanensis]
MAAMAVGGAGGSRVSSGRDLNCVPEIADTLGAVAKQGFDFLCMPVFHPRFKREFTQEPAKSRPGPQTRSDLLLSGRDWNTLIVGKLSPWIRPDSKVEKIRRNSEAAMLQELNFGAYLGLPAFLLPLNQEDNTNLARVLTNHIHTGHHSSMFWMRVPLVAPEDLRDDIIENAPTSHTEEYSGEEKTWMWWHNFRTLCDYSKRIAVALEIGADLPSNHVIDRWLGEPIKAAILPTSIFLTNKKGFPVLSKMHQRLIFRLLKLEVQFIITGTNHHSEKEFCSYLQYLEYLSQNRPPPNAYELFAKGYEDYLQSPLQPLMDNLESQTYEVFEKDPIKYSQYQQAIYKCLLDRVPEEEKDTNIQVLMVLGAGRGPLVNASLRAAKQADRRIKLYAVEKNPNAVVTLENWQFEEWGSQAQFEMPYVVRLHNFHQLSAPQPCFTFSHPNRDPMIDNNRYCTLEFPVEVNTVLHGFAGYFETVLYQDITLSIRPETHSPGMFSWFPILFPIKQPITVREGQTICVRFWRCSNSKKVWYEWAVTAPVCSAIHNPTGRSYTIGL